MTTSTLFGPGVDRSSFGDQGKRVRHTSVKFLLTMMAALRRWNSDIEERRQFAALGLRELDDIGLTRAERDTLLRR